MHSEHERRDSNQQERSTFNQPKKSTMSFKLAPENPMETITKIGNSEHLNSGIKSLRPSLQ